MKLILYIFLIFNLFADEEPTVEIPVEESTQTPDVMTLLVSAKAPCDQENDENSCERNVVYESITEEIHIFVADNRHKTTGDMDINKILRDPANFNGQIQSVSLRKVFKISEQKFQSVNAFLKNKKQLRIKVSVDGKALSKVVQLDN